MSDSKAIEALREQQLKPEDIEELQAIANENADLVADENVDPLSVIGLRGVGMDDEAIAGAFDIGAQMVRQGMYDQAFDYFMGMVQFEPVNWEIYRMLGIIQHRKRNHVAAGQLYGLALTLKPDDALTQLYLGECELHLGQHQYGLANVKAAVEALRGSPEHKAYVKRGEQILASQAAKGAK